MRRAGARARARRGELDDRVRASRAARRRRDREDAARGRGRRPAAPAPIDDTDAERAARAFNAKVKGDEAPPRRCAPSRPARRRRPAVPGRPAAAAARAGAARSRRAAQAAIALRSPRRGPAAAAISAMLGSAAGGGGARGRAERSRSRSRSYSSRSSYSRSRSPVPRRPPPDARNELDRLKGGHYEGRAADDPYWEHDQYDPHAPPPERIVDERYEPPQPEWFSKAGGVCIANPRAWMNERRERESSPRFATTAAPRAVAAPRVRVCVYRTPCRATPSTRDSRASTASRQPSPRRAPKAAHYRRSLLDANSRRQRAAAVGAETAPCPASQPFLFALELFLDLPSRLHQ